MAARDSLNKDQMVRVLHFSEDRGAPHSQDHFMKDIYEQGTGDRRFTNDVIFAGDSKDIYGLKTSFNDRGFIHVYDVPSTLVSPETFADDDHPQESSNYIKGPQLELGNDLPARREDAVTNQRVVKFINSREARGGMSYILPKSKVDSGDIKYQGMVPSHYPWEVDKL